MAVYKNGLVEITNVRPSVKYYQYMDELYRTLCSLMYMSLEDQLSYLVERYYPDTILEEAKTLITLAENYKSTEQYLTDLVLEASVPSSSDDYVNLTTVHSAKGLEYKTVFVLDLIDGVTPKTEENTDEDNEELRCLYVALTRAKKNLYLFAPRSYRSGGFNTYQTILSHFMNHDDVIATLDTSQSRMYLNRLRQKYNSFYSYPSGF